MTPWEDFTSTQKKKILEQNAKNNGGVIKADRTGEILVKPEKHTKGVTPPSNEAHIDHVDPKSKSGRNSYRNAEVRSRENNIKKSNKTE